MKNFTTINVFLVLFIINILLTGCAGINVMEFQDAETLGKGNSSLGFGISGGVNTTEVFNDSVKTMKRHGSAIIPLQATFQTGLSENLDIGASLWNSSLFSNFVRFAANFNSYSDLGASLNLKYRVTSPDSKRNLAFTVTLLEHSGHYDHDYGSWESSTYGLVPGILYSHSFFEPVLPENAEKKKKISNFLNSLYAGFKVYFISTDIHYSFPQNPSDLHIQENHIIYDPFAGVSFGEEKRYFIETHLTFMKERNTDNMKCSPHIGIGAKFYF